MHDERFHLLRLLIRHAILIVTRLRIVFARWTDRVAVILGANLMRGGARFVLFPHRNDSPRLPPPFDVGLSTFDVVADLEAYTGLPRKQVEELLERRHDSFRLEWHGLPPELRVDSWYYLSSRNYLFANAIHIHSELDVVASIAALVPTPARLLDFGGGTGNLALALTAHGHLVDYIDVSALQKDFVRFRTTRYPCGSQLNVLDSWRPLEPASYDLVVALDVFEHLTEVASTVDELTRAIRPEGLLVESSPFGANISNPMHHVDPGFDRLLRAKDFRLVSTTPDFRVWRR